MTANLNQAFIKAYSKESSNRAKSDEAAVAAPESSVMDDLVIRFDTASMEIPAPNVTPASSAKPMRSAKPALSKPTRRDTQPSGDTQAVEQGGGRVVHEHAAEKQVPAPKLSVAGDVRQAEVVYSDQSNDASLRQSIASHMMQAGDWQGQQLDAFWGSESANAEAAFEEQLSRESATRVLRARIESPETPAVAPASKPEPEQEASESATEINAAAETALEDQAALKHSTEVNRIPELQPPASPALSDETAPDTAEITRPKTTNAGVSTEPSEIFRLDKPSYYDRAAILDGTDAESSVSESDLSEISELAAAPTQLDRPIVRTDKPNAGNPPAKKVDPIMAEAQLREATNRIFNPVWEVDNLHWPHICFDLLSRGGGQMDAVAENLVAACQEGLQVMAVTSPKGGEGRTTIACCLAILAGSRGLKVAIVDGDLDSPSLSFQTNLDVDQDWRTALEHQLPLEEVAIHSIEDQVTVVPLLSPVSHEELAADDDRIAGMLSELAESFDLVIVDMGPMESPRSLVSTMGECGILSAVVTVVDSREEAAEQLEACLRRIRQSGVVSVGLVENFAA